jgi:hypothetical protein
VFNPARVARVHLVIDTVGGPQLWDRIDHPDLDALDVLVDAPEPVLAYERVNQPLVMTPWELEHAIDVLLSELDESEPAAAAALDPLVIELVRAWHDAWATYGDAPDGWDRFVALRNAADAAVAKALGEARLPNGAFAIEAIRQHALRAAIDPDRGAP